MRRTAQAKPIERIIMTKKFIYPSFAALALVFTTTKALALTIDRASCEKIKIGHAAEVLQNTLAWLPTLKGVGEASVYHNKIFNGDVSGAVYKKYLESRIESIVCITAADARDKDGQQTGGNYLNGIVSISEDFLAGPSTPKSRLELLTFLIHEATHHDADHIECHDPKNRAIIIRECDADYRGSNAVSAIFLYNLAKHCTNCLSNDRNSSLYEYETLFFDGLAWLDWVEGNDNDLLRRDAGFFNL